MPPAIRQAQLYLKSHLTYPPVCTRRPLWSRNRLLPSMPQRQHCGHDNVRLIFPVQELPLSDISSFFLHCRHDFGSKTNEALLQLPKLFLLGNTNSNLIGYEDSICAQQVKGFLQDICLRYSATLLITSVMFTCDDPANNPQPTSTFTATATRIAGVATSPAQGTNAAISSKTSASTTTVGRSSPTSANTGNSGSASSTGSAGLKMSDKIAIGVRVGVGITSIIIALVAWLWPRHGKVGGGHMRNMGWN
jgi:hypothetical protein